MANQCPPWQIYWYFLVSNFFWLGSAESFLKDEDMIRIKRTGLKTGGGWVVGAKQEDIFGAVERNFLCYFLLLLAQGTRDLEQKDTQAGGFTGDSHNAGMPHGGSETSCQ
ncbi:hypothetical protein QBC36DRAFT_92075 [Triangularia setosa]|uniref:Uncharacterized protein n=1 Tax=Triangularia setosa TaxID=2587417 RepID=A0AAN6WBP4_9PEZI|nr:hypothetical protein QBC36DRAFT_92075 [Podospora setosa]